MYRIGNKTKIAKEIIQHFPEHSVYIEPFFGIGGIYLNKPLAKKNILNDLDDDVFNISTLLLEDKKELIRLFQLMPIAAKTFDYLKTLKTDCKIQKALRFIYLSNLSLFGKENTMMLGNMTHKSTIIANLEKVLLSDYFQKAQFENIDFREFFKRFSIAKDSRNTTFIYNDPPYISTQKQLHIKWNKRDFDDLLQINIDYANKFGFKFAISEFDHKYVLAKAKEHNLKIIYICTRKNIRKKSNEILIVNY